MDPGASSMAGRCGGAAARPTRCVSTIRNGGAKGCNLLRLPFTYHALIAAHTERGHPRAGAQPLGQQLRPPPVEWRWSRSDAVRARLAAAWRCAAREQTTEHAG